VTDDEAWTALGEWIVGEREELPSWLTAAGAPDHEDDRGTHHGRQRLGHPPEWAKAPPKPDYELELERKQREKFGLVAVVHPSSRGSKP